MAFESPRIVELRRRVQADPSSIAFAQLAEEHRRAGSFDEAVRVCRAGLERHPGYLSARVTLGRALMEIGELDEAAREFALVLGSAPDNLAAIRGVAEIHQRRGDLAEALHYYQMALGLARHDPDLEETVAQIARSLGDRKEEDSGLGFEQAKNELLAAAERLPMVNGGQRAADPPADAPASGTAPASDHPSASELFDLDQLLEALGQPREAPAPPQVEVFLSGATPAADAAPGADTAGHAAEAPAAPAQSDDILGQIEEDLRRLEADAPSAAPGDPAGSPEPDLTPGEQAALDELERWLHVLEDARRPSSPA